MITTTKQIIKVMINPSKKNHKIRKRDTLNGVSDTIFSLSKMLQPKHVVCLTERSTLKSVKNIFLILFVLV